MLTREMVAYSHGQRWHYQRLDVEQVPFIWHYHPEFELTLTRRARGMRYVGGDVAPFGELDLMLVGPNQAHTWQAPRRVDGALHQVEVIFFTREWIEELAAGALPEMTGLAQWLRGAQNGVEFSLPCAERMTALFDRLKNARGLTKLGCLLEILDGLPRDHGARFLAGARNPDVLDQRIELALAWLHQHYREPVTLADLAAVARTSEATLKRLLREQLRDNMSGLLGQLRIGHACNLLITTQLQVQLVGEQSGFPSPSHFYKQFAAAKGLSPGDFRRRYHLSHRQNAARDNLDTPGLRFRYRIGEPSAS
ncbi:helix-turn-helix domain-containing protein [Amantichitinum ursilacus]|uniref:DNA-binding transcriptional regulator AraC n=1 Tax=Amantichitinum ursilacus TaxID=857265 RepID=A0A0N1JS24_9NEIS|nr:AraC family transcriptional regulator [Amantichitinum ursilacus]KPC50510.1 DNA-binding transcriptional regulator AraC [Amantichitinum ursilacus]